MKRKLFKLSTAFYLGLSLFTAATIVSCSNDEHAPYTVPTFNGTIKAITSEEFTIDSKMDIPNAVYRWKDNATGKVLSNEPILKYSYAKPGKQTIVLTVQQGQEEKYYTYTIEVEKRFDYEYVTLDLSSFDLSDGLETTGGKVWKDTYTDGAELQSGIFKFKHVGWSQMDTWFGFTVSNSSDNTDQYLTDGWLDNQWGRMPQGGVAGKGTPFLVSYADHKPHEDLLDPDKPFNTKRYSAVVSLDSNDKYKAVSTQLAISPWPYYGILGGDDYANKFKEGDFFAIHIYGVGEDDMLTRAEPITHYFVDFRQGITDIDTNWNKVDLSPLGEVKHLAFFLETTDVGQNGPNTALYFTMDNLVVDKIIE